jgi:hypothetical protein
MKKNIVRKIFLLSLTALMSFAVFGSLKALIVTAEPSTVYVKSTGKDYGKGTESAPYRTVERALEKVVDGGTIVLQDTVALTEWTVHEKTVTITGETLDATALSSLQIYDNVTFTDINIVVNTDEYICANGYTVVMGEGVSLSNAVDVYGGGHDGTTVPGTSLTLLSGTYRCVYGGSLRGTVDGDTHLTVGGAVNANIDTTNHDGAQYFFGGGYSDTITGSTYLHFGGNAKSIHLFGGSNDGNSTIGYSANLTVTGGTSMSMYGGNRNVDAGCDANAVVTGGTFEQVFGGNERASLTGNVDLRVIGGTITRRIYGGCYNDTSGLSFSSNYAVSGNIDLTIGSGASITYGYDGNDLSVYAHSRHSTNSPSESANLIFADAAVYANYDNGALKLKAQDSTMKFFIGSLSVADEIHYYRYSTDNNVITQSCAVCGNLSATATVSISNEALQYTGERITPVSITYSDDWEYDELMVSYENNIEEGTASYIVSAESILLTDTFAIRKAPIVLGGSVRLSAPAGLRFQSKVSETLVKEGATFGTLVIPKAVLGEEVLTHKTVSVRDIPQTKWATESVKQNNPEDYEEGYAYFNGVLTDIPEEHYDKVIVARSYACLNGVYYYSEPMERSIAQVAAYAIQDGYTEDVLYTYVDTALSEETLSMESNVTIEEGFTYQLNLTGNKDYVAVWQSSENSIVSVDKNGCVTALNEGTAIVIAQIGNRRVECRIVVKQGWTEGY